MKKLYTSKILGGFLFSGVLFFGTNSNAQLTENFDNITTLTGAGWFMQNNSVPVGSINWFQGNPTVYAAFNGATDSYIGANFNNTTGANTISNWLVTPNFTIKNGDVVTFYTRCSPDNMYPDNLQLRMSTNGASTNVGTGSAAVGDFTTLLLEINPTLVTSVYPYTAWTQYSVTISGLTAPTSGRFAFRYYVPNGGPSGLNSDYIGIDNFVYTPYVCPTLTVGPGSLTNGTAGVVYNQTLTQTGALGATTYSISAGALPPGMTLSTGGVLSGTPSATGTYNFTVLLTDASGCTGSSAFTLTIDCPTNGANLATFPQFCDDDAPYIMSEGSPSGGTYSGTGVTGSSFNPSVGTSVITYSLVDVYACPQSAMATITVNNSPTVTLGTYTALCSNAGTFDLTGGESPTGGVFSGTGVTGNSFNPLSGSSSITYTFTDGNGCSNFATQPITVNTAPTVTQTPFTDLCQDAAPLTLSGGSPAGGVYSGTGVSGGMFDPTTPGTFTITYTLVDGNGCSGMATDDITVNICIGINENEVLSDFSCYPNPTDGIFTIQFTQEVAEPVSIRILNVEGKIIFEESLQNFSGKYSKQFDLSQFGSGVYVVEVKRGTTLQTQLVKHME
jgi:hypothetical protein